jgi:hypothetical protein
MRSLWLAGEAQHCVGRLGPRLSTYSFDPIDGVISPTPEVVCNPRLTIRCEYPDTHRSPTTATFCLSRSYGIRTVSDAHGWFRRMMRENEEFEVETDGAGESPLSFSSETVRSVVVE